MLIKQSKFKCIQAGASLMEALVAILIFSIGIIAMMALQAVSIKNSIDAKYRADASYLANKIIAEMWVDRPNINSYSNFATSVTPACTPAGTASTYGKTIAWASEVAAALPGATANKQSIVVTTVAGITQVSVMVCWKSPQETETHNFLVTAQINL